ncbi:thermonuclease family protein [Sphingobacterium sp. SRCM116780]|uniref:thermonuclease family protein n=1 Tax=Sphingobacterium sp. SRCM116780 TaxID=2907623 RepID=UPI001F241FCD|nr:thermonuclease family protein [Sphingobacterium sp. SRCM116780]UIR54765.1 thermonuclease family protein [Sphingobacterium sp. SRCM116780]
MNIIKISIKYFLSFLILFLPIICFCGIIKGKVVRVSDGDTITILDSTNTQIRVRFYGIDCPEKGQDFANVARQFTSDLCFSKMVTVDVKDIDRYGRRVGIVWTSDSVDVNLALLKSGLAWHYKMFDKSDEFAQAEHLAQLNKSGLWRQRNAVRPWEYRRSKKLRLI